MPSNTGLSMQTALMLVFIPVLSFLNVWIGTLAAEECGLPNLALGTNDPATTTCQMIHIVPWASLGILIIGLAWQGYIWTSDNDLLAKLWRWLVNRMNGTATLECWYCGKGTLMAQEQLATVSDDWVCIHCGSRNGDLQVSILCIRYITRIVSFNARSRSKLRLRLIKNV